MKLEAISTHERALIIQHLSRFGDWEANRLGAHVRIARYRTAGGTKTMIQFAVGRGKFNQHGNAPTVGEAVDEINKLVKGRPDLKLSDVPLFARRIWSSTTERLPYRDSEVEA